MSEQDPRRKRLRLADYDYSSYGAYFVTVVVHDRSNIFGDVRDDSMYRSAAGDAVLAAWSAVPERFATVELDSFAVMPNHIHGIMWLLDDVGKSPGTSKDTESAKQHRPSLPMVMRAFKSTAAIAANRILNRSGAVWQRSYFEKVIRTQKQLDTLRRYIDENPLRWALDEENVAYRTSDRR